jgi:TonB family protein
VATGSPEIADALTEATYRADSLRSLPALPGDGYPRDGRFVFEIQESLKPPEHAVAFARLRLQGLEIETLPTLDRITYPHYPIAAQQRAVEGFALFQFVVDASGTAEPGSFVLLQTNYRDFAEAAMTALRQTTYHPALVGGCPVPSLVTQRVGFKVSR